MATDAVPARASGGSIAQAGWFRFVVRAAIALLAFWTLSFAADRYIAFVRDGAPNRYDDSLWLFSVGAMVVAGALFGLATWLSFTRVGSATASMMLRAVAESVRSRPTRVSAVLGGRSVAAPPGRTTAVSLEE